MSNPKKIYLGEGQMIEIRMCQSAYDTNHSAWQDRMYPESMLLRVMDAHELRISDHRVNVFKWAGDAQYLPDKNNRIAELQEQLERMTVSRDARQVRIDKLKEQLAAVRQAMDNTVSLPYEQILKIKAAIGEDE